MLPAYILSLREGLEAALILGIIFGTLRRVQRPKLAFAVWAGAGSAALLSLLTAVILTWFGWELRDPGEAIFEGITMLLAAGILTWMIFWMTRQSRNLQTELEASAQRAFQAGKWSLFGLAFVAVLREGVELALFLTAAAFSSSALQTILGAVLGLGTACLLGWSLFSTTIRLDLRRFFQVTGLLLILFAAGLVGRGVGELVEVGWLPAIIEHAWDLGKLISPDSIIGQILGTLFGYNANPSLMEVLAYAVYIGTVLLGLWAGRRRQQPAPVATSLQG